MNKIKKLNYKKSIINGLVTVTVNDIVIHGEFQFIETLMELIDTNIEFELSKEDNNYIIRIYNYEVSNIDTSVTLGVVNYTDISRTEFLNLCKTLHNFIDKYSYKLLSNFSYKI